MTVDDEVNYERNQFVIQYNNMKNKYCMSPYSGYDYKTCGSILHYLYIYCGLHYAEHYLVGEGKVMYPGDENIFAKYFFDENSNIPVFYFCGIYESNSAINMFIDNQNIFIKGLEEEALNGIKKDSDEWKHSRL